MKSKARSIRTGKGGDGAVLLFDIGNTHTHVGLAGAKRVLKQTDVPTREWNSERGARALAQFVGSSRITGAALCSVVPRTTPLIKKCVKKVWSLPCLELTSKTVLGVGINYPNPETIGPDRLANAVAVRHYFGAPSLVVDFGTAVTFDVVDESGDYVGGIISPGLAVMTDYLHEKTALLPRIQIREIRSLIGKSTGQAMLAGAVHGYRGLIRELIMGLKRELGTARLPVVATGGYARLIASKLTEISAVDPLLTLKGLYLVWKAHKDGLRG